MSYREDHKDIIAYIGQTTPIVQTNQGGPQHHFRLIWEDHMLCRADHKTLWPKQGCPQHQYRPQGHYRLIWGDHMAHRADHKDIIAQVGRTTTPLQTILGGPYVIKGRPQHCDQNAVQYKSMRLYESVTYKSQGQDQLPQPLIIHLFTFPDNPPPPCPPPFVGPVPLPRKN